MNNPIKNWHQAHKDSMSFGARIADKVATGMGSWRFIIIQTLIVALWMILNAGGVRGSDHHDEPEPRGRTRPRAGPSRLRHKHRRKAGDRGIAKASCKHRRQQARQDHHDA